MQTTTQTVTTFKTIINRGYQPSSNTSCHHSHSSPSISCVASVVIVVVDAKVIKKQRSPHARDCQRLSRRRRVTDACGQRPSNRFVRASASRLFCVSPQTSDKPSRFESSGECAARRARTARCYNDASGASIADDNDDDAAKSGRAHSSRRDGCRRTRLSINRACKSPPLLRARTRARASGRRHASTCHRLLMTSQSNQPSRSGRAARRARDLSRVSKRRRRRRCRSCSS